MEPAYWPKFLFLFLSLSLTTDQPGERLDDTGVQMRQESELVVIIGNRANPVDSACLRIHTRYENDDSFRQDDSSIYTCLAAYECLAVKRARQPHAQLYGVEIRIVLPVDAGQVN
jgi:hypothetical protein